MPKNTFMSDKAVVEIANFIYKPELFTAVP